MAQQTIIGVSIEDLERAVPKGDSSMRLLSGILGDDFVRAPFSTAGASASLFGDIMFIFNGILFAIGVAFLSYQVIASIAESASAGEVLGKNKSDVYAVPRIGAGIIGMVPMFGGFSLAQAIMMSAITLGVGAANMLTGTLLDSTARFKSIVPSYSLAASEPTLSSDVSKAVRGLFLSELCVQGQRATAPGQEARMRPLDGQGEYGWDFGQCGRVAMVQRKGHEVREESDALGFRVASVDYSAIATAAQGAGRNALTLMRIQTYNAAEEYVRAINADGVTPASAHAAAMRAMDTLETLENEIRTGLRADLKNAAQGQGEAVQRSVMDGIKSQGWIALGSFYSTFAEVGAAIADGQKSWAYVYAPGRASEDLNITPTGDRQALKSFLIIADRKEDAKPEEGFFEGIINSVLPEPNATGNRSFGQQILSFMTNKAAGDSGGAGLVNPIIAAKNLGDFMITVGQTGIATGTAAGLVPTAKVGKFVGQVSGGLSNMGEVLSAIFWLLIGVGAFLSIVIPMQIFLTWFTALGVYLTSIFESMIGAQLAAFAHIKMQGTSFAEGNAAKFYRYLLNLLLRPALMVIGFVAASACLIGLGSLLLPLFGQAVAGAQGNSITGLILIPAFLLLFAFMLFGLVQTCANLIIELPNRALNWMGEAAESGGGAVLGAAVGSALVRMRGPGPAAAGAAMKGTAGALRSKPTPPT